MKPWVWCLFVACNSERAADHGTPVTMTDPGARHSIDITTSGPVSIRGVVVRARPDGVLEVTYRVDATGPALVPARTMCRVGDRNVVYPMSSEGKVAGPRLSSLYRADPFGVPASVCEIEFFYAPDADTRWQVTGRACFQGAALTNGACPATSFPPPVLATASAVALERAALELRDRSATVTALFTLAQPLAEDRRFASRITCEDSLGKVTGDAALTFVPLAEIPVGASVFGPVTFALERTPSPDAHCAVDILSRTLGETGGERIHAQVCLTLRSVRPGRC